MLTKSKLDSLIVTVRGKIAELDDEKRSNLDAGMAIEFDEHFAFQTQQARAHAEGILELDAAQLIYRSLGEVGSPSNGGWAKHTDTATKVIVTQLMGELLSQRIRGRRVA